jgi:hypothetical protein
MHQQALAQQDAATTSLQYNGRNMFNRGGCSRNESDGTQSVKIHQEISAMGKATQTEATSLQSSTIAKYPMSCTALV